MNIVPFLMDQLFFKHLYSRHFESFDTEELHQGVEDQRVVVETQGGGRVLLKLTQLSPALVTRVT